MDGQQLKEERLMELKQRRLAAFADFQEWTRMGLDGLELTLSTIEEKEAELRTREPELVVLVRKTAGPDVTVYHSSEAPCGRVTGAARSRSSFDQRFEGEARARRLHRCSACRWPDHLAS
ncbi:MAG: hypothetical protein ACOYBY_15820 [Dermatophilaceae bacterium]